MRRDVVRVFLDNLWDNADALAGIVVPLIVSILMLSAKVGDTTTYVQLALLAFFLALVLIRRYREARRYVSPQIPVVVATRGIEEGFITLERSMKRAGYDPYPFDSLKGKGVYIGYDDLGVEVGVLPEEDSGAWYDSLGKCLANLEFLKKMFYGLEEGGGPTFHLALKVPVVLAFALGAMVRKLYPVVVYQYERGEYHLVYDTREKIPELGVNELEELSELRVEGEGEFGIVTSGVGYLYALEAVKLLGVEVKVLKLGMTHPLPERILSEFLEGVERVLVVEELEPFLEDRIRAVAKDANPDLEVLGKRSGHLPRVGEYNAEIVVKALAEALGESPPVDFKHLRERASEVLKKLPPRPPVLCPACPHRATGYAMKRALGARPVYLNDIGCYALLFQKPFELAHVTHAMGSSMGFASGIDVATDRTPVVLIGDSTFFHAGIPALINAIHQKRRVIVAVLDNRITAMTGHQPHPGVPRRATGEEAIPIDIEKLVRGLGVGFVRVVDPYDFKEAEKAFREAEKHEGVAVVVWRRECALLTVARVRREKGKIVPYRVDPEKCTYCRVCIMTYACPAFVDVGDRVEIDPAVCFGCGSCIPVCPYGAIVPGEGAVDWRRDGYGV